MNNIDFYGWYIQLWDSSYNDKTQCWYEKYIIRIGDNFVAQTDHQDNYPRLTKKEFEAKVYEKAEDVLNYLLFILESKYIGWIQECPKCYKKVQTTCSACGCGSCLVCGYRFVCNPIQFSGLENHVFKNLEVRFPQINGNGEGVEGIS